jgi:hypothetical protein
MKRAPTSPALPLSQAEQRFLNALRAMRPDIAAMNLDYMEDVAKEFPRHTAPSLRLVTGGAS